MNTNVDNVVQNVHPMQARAKSGIHKLKILMAAIEPTSVKATLQDSCWLAAMKDKLQALQRNNTWTLVHLPAGRFPIGCKWVFCLKENTDDTIAKHKARLVSMGFHQQSGFDCNATFSPLVKPITIQVVFNYCFVQGLENTTT
ncbi:uncharacterized mitochondrial protein AtMg00820-like [Humulus lupulus]|uniref:uncharacterized mitochondrial protein AtMg00820-like n=1 Tax=Humulus lupulus TaxID=3486 RepID=UPI002B408DDC|nr:uncharacterized mitochondrial protein AtMg00820-like [Humulus lupulus]